MFLNLRGSGPLYRRIYHALKSEIGAGRLRPHTRLPSTRALPADLSVSRNTVMLAYEQLIAEGYLLSRHRSTTVVAGDTLPRAATARVEPPAKKQVRLSSYGRYLIKDPAMPPSGSYAHRPGVRYDFRYGRPAVDAFPREVWRRLLAARERVESFDSYGYGPPAGYAPLREALTQYLRRARARPIRS